MTNDDRRSTVTVVVVATILSLATAFSLGGCKNYLDESTDRTVGEFTDDATIALIVKKRLIGDRDVRGLRINVEVNRSVVTLIGKVRSEEERKRALAIASGVANVARVVDQLELP